jgi:hypothetical protein
MPYRIGPVRPHVQAAAEEIGDKFEVRIIHGVGIRPGRGSDHPTGLALDFMVGSKKGDDLADYAMANAARLGIKYIIWKQRIWNRDKGLSWKPMEDRGNPTANHMDHVHISFNNSPGVGNIIPGIGENGGGAFDTIEDAARDSQLGEIYRTFQAFTKMFAWLNSPGNWLRILAFLGGAALLFTALVRMTNG